MPEHSRRSAPAVHLDIGPHLRDAIWVVGGCWLFCGRGEVPVTWLGPCRTPRWEVPMYGCEDCVERLEYMGLRAVAALDAPLPWPREY
ncbi:hypothetical protein ABT354_11050 [Streptomyces sp. NPDC000594]|uniref:hypothetical protein n=1 Tax=Streptomyces sp. NPDC000594 TaxID=3154261 RepID=UPI003329325E